MENKGFERFSKAWKKSEQADSTKKLYSVEDVKLFKMKKSKDFSRTLNNSIIFDFVQKAILMAAMLVLIWFYRIETGLIIAFIGLIGLSSYLIYSELIIKRKLDQINEYDLKLSEVIGRKIQFFRQYFPNLRWMLAFTNALLVWVGSLFYFYSRYGFYRLEDIIDITVAVLMVVFAFGGSFLIYTFQFRFNVKELEQSLNILHEDASASETLLALKKKSIRMTIAKIIAFMVGLGLFVYLLASYMSR